jgi:hypothetical protein
MNRALASLPLIASLGLASCTNSAAGPDAAAGHDREENTSPTLAIHSPATSTEKAAPTADPVVASKPHEAAPLGEDDLHRAQVVGVWKQCETGIRWLRVRDDGTATMFVDPGDSWTAKALIGDGLTIQIEWSINDGRVLMRSLSGEPASAFKAVSALYGTDRDRKIARLDDEKFVMLDDSDGSKSEWSRVGTNEELPKAIATK